ncbi:MAG: hypothetical protein ACRC37_04695 [Lentisphaeria bacterium]
MKKRNNGWKEDLRQYYAKTSVMARIGMCALLSGLIANVVMKKHIRPQVIKINELNKKISAMKTPSNPSEVIGELRETQEEIIAQLEQLRKENGLLIRRYGDSLSAGNIGKTILDIKLLINKNRLKIISEERIKELVGEENDHLPRRNNYLNMEEDTKIKLFLPNFLLSEGFIFKFVGTYKDIQKFLLELHKMKKVFFVNNVKLSSSKVKITDRDFKEHRAVECSFEVHVPYRK